MQHLDVESLVLEDIVPSYFCFSFWLMPAFMLKKIVLGNFASGPLDPEMADGIDFMVDRVGVLWWLWCHSAVTEREVGDVSAAFFIHDPGGRSGKWIFSSVDCHSPSTLTDSLTLFLSSVYLCQSRGVKELRWKRRKCWDRSVGHALGTGTTHGMWFRHLSPAE